ncbi:MAG: VTT domain-containing protein [Myxococcota bacterium]|nr:VTT domain-containing protein [Myxococcota bacterium]
MLDGILEFLKENAGIEALALVFTASASEYILPPLPADTVIVLSSLLVIAGTWSFASVYFVVVAGGLFGSILQYMLGYSLVSKSNSRTLPLFVRRWMGGNHITEFTRLFRKYGYWLILFNRFMPGLRAAVFLACGAAGLNSRWVITLGLVSNLLWSALLLQLGLIVGENFEKIQTTLNVYRNVAIVIMIAFVGVFAYRRWRQRRLDERGEKR